MKEPQERPVFQSDAKFRLEFYTVSHSSLLLRGPAAAPSGGHIDLMFYGTLYLDVPQELQGVQVDAPTPEEVRYVAERAGRSEHNLSAQKLHILISGGRRYFIVASEFHIKEQPPGYMGHSLFE